ncbi:hypothetical protein WISP_13644 [Willisornis vidua]|uniref:Rho GTPase-activating protein 27 n=1 Tax=Willisornis vidua TaxID=1566151 RepID=A0ABQ9DWE5_9PASS|nr:hypothetical protein WISP_13644 [Willisornis vidua]
MEMKAQMKMEMRMDIGMKMAMEKGMGMEMGMETGMGMKMEMGMETETDYPDLSPDELEGYPEEDYSPVGSYDQGATLCLSPRRSEELGTPPGWYRHSHHEGLEFYPEHFASDTVPFSGHHDRASSSSSQDSGLFAWHSTTSPAVGIKEEKFKSLEKAGVLNRTKTVDRGKRLRKNWSSSWTVLEGGILTFFKDSKHSAAGGLVFGCSLLALCERERGTVPRFVLQCIQTVERRGLDIDGLYRVSGNLATIQKLRYKVEHDEQLDLDDGRWEDIHVVTGALKLFLRELPEPLVPFSHFDNHPLSSRCVTKRDSKAQAPWGPQEELGMSHEVMMVARHPSTLTTPEHTVELRGATLAWASRDKSSKKNVLELRTREGSEFLIQHDSEQIITAWHRAIADSIGRRGSDVHGEEDADSVAEFGSREKLGSGEDRRAVAGQGPGSGSAESDSSRVRNKLRKFLQRRPTLQSLRERGYIKEIQDQAMRGRCIRDLVLSLPPAHHDTMKVLFRHLCRVIEHKEENRMSVQSVAIVFGPTLLRPPSEEGNMAIHMVFQNQVVEHILNHYGYIFPDG